MTMNYISKLNDTEKKNFCNIISGDAFKDYFKKNQKEYNKIKSWYRAEKIPKNKAVSLAIENINKSFISDFMDNFANLFLTDIKKQLREEEINVLAKILRDSPFKDNIALYFKLNGDDVDNLYLEKIQNTMSNITNKNDENVQTINENSKIEIENLKKQLEKYKEKLLESEKKYKIDFQDCQKKQDELEKSLSNMKERLHKALDEKSQLQVNLEQFNKLRKFDDTGNFTDTISSLTDDYVSICQVIAPELIGKVKYKALRLADIDREGNLISFQQSNDEPPYFENRKIIFINDGPKDKVGKLATWSWTAKPNNNDYSKDYVESKINGRIEPVEIVTFYACKSKDEIINKLKTGISLDITTSRIMVAFLEDKSNYWGLLCRNDDFEKTNNELFMLKNNTIQLPCYEFSKNDIVCLSNNKKYLKTVNIGIPSMIVNVKGSTEVINDILLERSSWREFKKLGKQKSDWKLVRDFLTNVDLKSVTEEVEEKLNCSSVEAQKMLEDYLENINCYIDGNTIEDQVILSALYSNEELMKRCKSLIMVDWKAENKNLIDKREDLQNEIEKKRKTAKNELEKLQNREIELAEKLEALNKDIEDKKEFANNVDAAVNDKIKQAQQNAANFVANFAFLPKATTVNPGKNSYTELIDESCNYYKGKPLDSNDIEINDTIENVLDTIKCGLLDAGVIEKYCHPLATYMYIAYLDNCPLLLIGPNATAIVDAFSGAIFGKKAGILECNGKYNSKIVELCNSSDDNIIRVVNPFNGNWISRLPDIISNDNKFFISVYPYSEDMQIEPASLFNYMLPVLTEPLIENPPTGEVIRGVFSDDHEEYKLVGPSRTYEKILKKFHAPLLIRNRIKTLITNMHELLGNDAVDYDVLFALLPYAFTTMQMPILLDMIQNTTDRHITISKELEDIINTLFGEDDE